MNRRTFLATTAILTQAETLPRADAAPAPIPIVDCHIHLFDTTRPQGVPWPDKTDATLYKPASMERYRKIVASLGIVGAIEVEASPWFDDNQWVLDIAAKDKMIVGHVGDLEPDKPAYRQQLDNLHKNPLFRGIRYGNIWNRDLYAALDKPEFVAGLKALADADLMMDSANPDPRLIAALLKLSDKVPNLRIVLDHLPRIVRPTEAAALKEYQRNLHELGKRRLAFAKVSGVAKKVNGKVPEDIAPYKATLDEMWDVFGEDRLIYGSDWPNSDTWAQYPVELKIVRAYFATKGPAASEKYFWKNSLAAYKWAQREPSQPKS